MNRLGIQKFGIVQSLLTKTFRFNLYILILKYFSGFSLFLKILNRLVMNIERIRCTTVNWRQLNARPIGKCVDEEVRGERNRCTVAIREAKINVWERGVKCTGRFETWLEWPRDIMTHGNPLFIISLQIVACECCIREPVAPATKNFAQYGRTELQATFGEIEKCTEALCHRGRRSCRRNRTEKIARRTQVIFLSQFNLISTNSRNVSRNGNRSPVFSGLFPATLELQLKKSGKKTQLRKLGSFWWNETENCAKKKKLCNTIEMNRAIPVKIILCFLFLGKTHAHE